MIEDETLGPLQSLFEDGNVAYWIARNPSGSFWLLPKDRFYAAEASRVFLPSGMRMQWKWKIWGWGGAPGETIQIQRAVINELAEKMGMFDGPECGVIYIGTPGAYRKAVIGLWNRQEDCRVVKLSLSSLADPMIKDEAASLHRLAGSMQGSIPSILLSGVWRGRHFISISPFKGTRGSKALSLKHFAWCRRLFLADPKKITWEQSPFRLNLKEKYAVFSGRHWMTAPLAHVFNKVDDHLLGRVFTFGWAHRDFSPWNTRLDGGCLKVFDWEMARPDYPPAYDLFHFISIQAGLKNSSTRWSEKMLCSWLEDMAPEWKDFSRELYLLYLLDQAIFYMEARIRAPEAGNETFLAWLSKQVLKVGSMLR